MSTRVIPPMPEIGRSESFYAHQVQQADKQGDALAHEAWKVGQYITLGLDPRLSWEEKVQYFSHALRRHCVPPSLPDAETARFFTALANLVRQHAGQEALRIASREDDLFAARVSMGQPREKIEDEAEAFFAKLTPYEYCPAWFSEDDFRQIKMIRDQWI